MSHKNLIILRAVTRLQALLYFSYQSVCFKLTCGFFKQKLDLMNKQTKNFIFKLLAFKLLAVSIYYFGPPVHPHITRQVDTMSVTLRYWIRWTLEENSPYPLIPAYLSSGDHVGIQFMEFPLLNLILAPLFAFGVEIGRILNNFGLLFINLGLTFWAWKKWKGIHIKEVLVDDAFLLFPLISASSFFIYKQIPDYTAAILVILALGYSFREERRNFLASFLLLSLGVLIKPPQVIALAPLLLHNNRKYILKSMQWIVPASIPCILYYTLGSREILKLIDTPRYFGTDFRDPFTSLMNVLMHPLGLMELFLESFFGRFVGIPIMLSYFHKVYKNKSLKTSPFAFILILQVTALVLLDGSHLFIHNYYFCGIAMSASLIFMSFLDQAPKKLVYLAWIILSVSTVERMAYEIKPLFKDNIYRQCSKLKQRNPNFPWNTDIVFTSKKAVPPQLGLCFGVKQDSTTSDYGFFYKDQKIPARCKQVDREADIILTKCNS